MRYISILMASAAACLAMSATGVAAQPTFEGKTLRLIINFGAGGPLDGFFRAFVPHMERHLPGKPTIIVENRPGAAGRVGAAYMYNVAKPDGLTIGGMVGVVNDAIFGLPAKYDPEKFTWLGAIPQTQVTIVRSELGISSLADLQKPAKPIVLAGTGANSNNYIATSLALNMMNAPFKAVHGYAGQAATIHALRQGEANMTDAGAPIYLPNKEAWRKEGLVPVLQRGDLQPDGAFQKSPLIPDLPTMPEAIARLNPEALKSTEFAAYKLIAGTYALQYSIIAPPQVAPEVAAVLQKGVEAAFTDPRAIEDVKRQMNLEFNFLNGAQAQKTLQSLEASARENPKARKMLEALASVK
ncbi:MAG: tripartite tricarboxylate transporter substrate-binding protein [Beijerinckiaceae bacterium]|nr:tripartite tricarboxylate transporter substrate-binding protein [Beijerinckiaceae bacterium]